MPIKDAFDACANNVIVGIQELNYMGWSNLTYQASSGTFYGQFNGQTRHYHRPLKTK